ncbi:hypothetical protein, partial [Streptomyces albidoflavus]
APFPPPRLSSTNPSYGVSWDLAESVRAVRAVGLPYCRRGRNEARAAHARHVIREVLAER